MVVSTAGVSGLKITFSIMVRSRRLGRSKVSLPLVPSKLTVRLLLRGLLEALLLTARKQATLTPTSMPNGAHPGPSEADMAAPGEAMEVVAAASGLGEHLPRTTGRTSTSSAATATPSSSHHIHSIPCATAAIAAVPSITTWAVWMAQLVSKARSTRSARPISPSRNEPRPTWPRPSALKPTWRRRTTRPQLH